MSNIFGRPKREDFTPEQWVDAWADKHPLGWGYKEFRFLRSTGMPLKYLALAMGKNTVEPIKDVNRREGFTKPVTKP